MKPEHFRETPETLLFDVCRAEGAAVSAERVRELQ
jgi:hypothetical protein